MPVTLCRVSFSIPEDLYAIYEQDAADSDKTVEEVIISRLYTCRGHDSSRALYFDDKQRGRLEAMTGGRILPSADTALRRLENQASIYLDNTKVAFTPHSAVSSQVALRPQPVLHRVRQEAGYRGARALRHDEMTRGMR